MENGKKVIAKNPFRTGHGKVPPFLAGREDEKHKLETLVGRTVAGEVVSSNVHIFAPRGMGKTSLLEQVGGELRSLKDGKEGKAAVVMTAVNSMGTVDEARKTLVDDIGVSLRETLMPEKIMADLKVVLAEWTRTERSWSSVCESLAEKCRTRPIVFMVDEAHRLAPEVMAAVMDDIEMIRQKDGPIVGVFAGKPALVDLIAKAGVPYEERSEYISLDLLDESSSTAAIAYPLSASAMKISPEAMKMVVEEALGYPTYLQYWGSALWNRCIEKSGRNVVESQDVVSVRPEIEARKNLAYQSRFGQWSSEDVNLITSLTRRLRKTGDVNKPRLEEMVKEELHRQRRGLYDPDRIVQKMIDTDYVWSPMGTPNYKAALPSFFGFILNQEKDKAVQRVAEHVGRGVQAER